MHHSVNDGFVLKLSLTHTKPEAVERMSVDAVQLPDQGDGKLHHDADLGLLPLSVLKATTSI